MKFHPLILLATLSVCGMAGAQSNHSQVFFDSSGTDQAAYGANQIITISGNVTYYGRRDPRPEGGAGVVQNIAQDFVQPASDIYIVRHGYYHGNQGANFHLFLDDVSGGSPNTVLGAGGGGFFEQQIASTAPQGLLMSGEYDLVVDEHQNGYFEPNLDLYLGGKGYPPAITVSLPVGVTAIPNPAIDAMKAAGNAEFKAAVRLNAVFRVIEIAYDKIAADGVKTNIKDVFKAVKDEFKKPPDDDAPFKLGFTAARNALANKMKHGMGLVSDPPDPDFAELVVIAPALRADETDPDPLFAAAGAFANALDRESLLEGALLSSLEKYQGAAAAQNGRWALAHARGVAHFASLLAGEIERNQPIWVAMKAATTASPFDFDALLAGDRSLQARLGNSGFSVVEKQYLADLGLGSAQVAQGLEKFLARPRTASKAEWISALDAKIAAPGSSPAGMRQLATAMGAVITALLAEPTLDRDDPVIAMGGPFAGSASTPIAFSASATDFHGRGLIFEWDLDSDGEFDDATEPRPLRQWRLRARDLRPSG